jgi:hypothetical protein
MPIDFTKAKSLPVGAVKFFWTFSRMEFALKETGCLPKDGKACADWGAFAKRLDKLSESTFFDEVVTSGMADTLVLKPPKAQYSRNGALSFESMSPPRNTQQLLEAVSRVRNNLFHGGKSGEIDSDSVDLHRNDSLIDEAQWVLEQALLRDYDVLDAFEGRY